MSSRKEGIIEWKEGRRMERRDNMKETRYVGLTWREKGRKEES